MRFSYDEYAAVFKALSDASRVKIVHLLCSGEHCAGMLLEHFDLTQPTLSYHMRVLTGCGLVRARWEGSWCWYSICPNKGGIVRCFLEDIDAGSAVHIFAQESQVL